jgi:hypothetical protein
VSLPDCLGRSESYIWCPGEDSNLHGFHHWYLKPARLPIPPPGPNSVIGGKPPSCQMARICSELLIARNQRKRPPHAVECWTRTSDVRAAAALAIPQESFVLEVAKALNTRIPE